MLLHLTEAQSHHLAKLLVLLHILIQLGVSAQALLTDLQERNGDRVCLCTSA